MKVCEIWEDLEHPDNDYIFKYNRMVTPEEHDKLLKKIMPGDANIPYLMHKKMDIPISDCQKAYDVAIDYLRSQGKLRGGAHNG